jgi:predicted transcriptional regulator
MRRNQLILVSFLLAVSSARSEQLPKTTAESLAGQQMALPDALKGRTAVVIVGFSKSSQNAVKEWEARARKQLGEATDVYQIAVLEGAPSFVRGMIKRAMKSATPPALQSHFLVVVKGEAELKKAVAFSATDDPYLLVLDQTGEIRWRSHGTVSDESVKALTDQVAALK